ncbi:MAG: MarR family transcriptional regulator [bacterium]
MSSPESPERLALMARVGTLVSRWQDAVQRYDQLVGDHEGLTQTERHCIALLVGGAMAPHEIATGIHLTRAAVTSLLDRLEARGLVQRSPDANDRRRLIVALTRDGLDLCERHYGGLMERGQGLLASMSDADLTAMVRFLDEALMLQGQVTEELLLRAGGKRA